MDWTATNTLGATLLPLPTAEQPPEAGTSAMDTEVNGDTEDAPSAVGMLQGADLESGAEQPPEAVDTATEQPPEAVEAAMAPEAVESATEQPPEAVEAATEQPPKAVEARSCGHRDRAATRSCGHRNCRRGNGRTAACSPIRQATD
eukprot:6045564-Amphidinium_carterae.1